MENTTLYDSVHITTNKHAIREELTLKITSSLAADFISKPEFPSRNTLPDISSPPFLNFGHQILFDYKLFLKIIWNVIEDIKLIEKEMTIPLWIPALIGGGGMLSGILIEDNSVIIVSLIAALILWIIHLVLKSKNYSENIAAIKAAALEDLIKCSYSLKHNWISDVIEDCARVTGNGTFSADGMQVVTIHDDKQPFSGYGRLQIENLFICKEKNGKLDFEQHEIEELEDLIFSKIKKKVKLINKAEVVSGNVILINGKTLLIDSPWLDAKKTPRLWIDKEEFQKIQEVDARSSTRKYMGVQIIFPDYYTAASIFIRLFYTGNAVCCHLALTTIGPPEIEEKELLKRLAKHNVQKEQKNKNKASKEYTNLDKEKLRALNLLKFIYSYGNTGREFIVDKSREIINELDLYKIAAAYGQEYDEEFNDILKECTVWPGCNFESENWRERHSYTFTNDFFGKSECISSIKNIYEQISEIILDELDLMEYDISNYKDKEGKYIIHSEKIEQLIVGEKVYMKKEEKKEEVKEQKESTAI